MNVNNKKGYTAVLYRSPSQTNTVFNDFLSNFEKLLQELSALNPDFSIILGDFNARSKSWWKSDINTIEGTKIDSVTISYGSQQLITQPTHLLANYSSCIDLIFTDEPSLIVDCGIHPSPHPNRHHQIVYCKLDPKTVYPPPYQRLVWDFKRAIDCGVFPDTWKMSHIIPAHKKNDKGSLNNYRPVSLLPICGKFFERIIFNVFFISLR